MSDEKKASWAKAYEADAAQEVKQAMPANKPVQEEPSAEEGQPRARNQNVLPGILGRQLRAAYGELLNSPVPDAISELVRKLESTEAKKPSDEEGSQ